MTSMPPPPPPPRRNDASSAADLSNADFRRIVNETPRRAPPPDATPRSISKQQQQPAKKKKERDYKKYRPKPKDVSSLVVREEIKEEDPDQPKYRDRAKERREDQNPDYEVMGTMGGMGAGFGAFSAVAPPGAVDARDVQKMSIEKSKYLGGDVEHTHLVKGLDYALLNKVRSEMEKAPAPVQEEPQPEEKPKLSNKDEPPEFHSALAKVVYKWTVKPSMSSKVNEMFLPGRMAFVFDMEEMLHHMPTTLYRSKDDCPVPDEYVTVGVDAALVDRISKIMAYLKLGSGKLSKKRRKELLLDTRGVNATEAQPQEAPEPKPEEEPKPRNPEDDIFADAGTDYVVSVKNSDQNSEDMEESPRELHGGRSYFQDTERDEEGVQGPTMPVGEWQQYPPPPPELGQEERSLISAFKRDDKVLKQRREVDAREKDPNFVSESYSECYPGYQEYNREIVDSDEEAELTKMDIGGKGKGRAHRWDFASEEGRSKHDDQKEAKAAFGVKTQDNRKTRKQREQKLNNELNKINQILEKKKKAATQGSDDGEEEQGTSKKART